MNAAIDLDALLAPPPEPPDVRAHPDGATPVQPALITRRLADVDAEELRWMWPGRIPFGKLTALAGDPGVGKSYLAMALAAAVTTGRALPGSHPTAPADVLLASYEDEAGDTLRPRAELLGAHLRRLTVIEGRRDTDGGIVPFGPDAVADLDAHLEALGDGQAPALLVIDPVSAFVGAGVDTYRDNEVRAALEQLRGLAAARGLAVLLVMHLRKSAATSASPVCRAPARTGRSSAPRCSPPVTPTMRRRSPSHTSSTISPPVSRPSATASPTPASTGPVSAPTSTENGSPDTTPTTRATHSERPSSSCARCSAAAPTRCPT